VRAVYGLQANNLITFRFEFFKTAGHRGRASVGLDRSDSGIVGSNPAQNMDVCLRLSVLCCSVLVKDLRWADYSSKESHKMSK
jgi:hypothetical protein